MNWCEFVLWNRGNGTCVNKVFGLKSSLCGWVHMVFIHDSSSVWKVISKLESLEQKAYTKTRFIFRKSTRFLKIKMLGNLVKICLLLQIIKFFTWFHVLSIRVQSPMQSVQCLAYKIDAIDGGRFAIQMLFAANKLWRFWTFPFGPSWTV